MPSSLAKLCLALVLLASLAACSTMKRVTDAIPVPHLPKMKLPDVTKVIPGMNSSDSIGSEDPEIPFNARGALAYGHTLRIEVYDGVRSIRQLWKGLVMVDQQGVINFENIGSARVGGRTPYEATLMIQSVFRSAGKVASQAHVHLISVENNPLVTIEGDIRSPTVLPLWKGITIADAIAYAGGRRPGSSARSVYVSHELERRFFTTESRADAAMKLRAGDIITLSPDL